MPSPVWPAWAVCHLPADSAIIPVEVLPWLRLSAAELAEELAQRTSHRTGDLFARGLADHQIVRASCSPLVVDVTVPPEGYASQRRLNYGTDAAANGIETLVMAPACRTLTPAEQTVLLDRYYHPHQAWFAARVALKVAAHGRCLVVNALSFAPSDTAFAVDERLSPLPDIRRPYPAALAGNLRGRFAGARMACATGARPPGRDGAALAGRHGPARPLFVH